MMNESVDARDKTIQELLEQNTMLARNHLLLEQDFIEALDLLEGMTVQCCSIDTNDGKVGELDSMCLHSYVDAIRFLVKHNRAVIKSEQGRRIIAILKENK